METYQVYAIKKSLEVRSFSGGGGFIVLGNLEQVWNCKQSTPPPRRNCNITIFCSPPPPPPLKGGMIEPLSTRYLEPPPCFLFCHFVFMRVFQHCFIYMPKIQKGYLLQTQPYPWWTLYLEPPFCIRFGRLHQDEMRDMMKKETWCVVFHDFYICKYDSTKKTKIKKKNDTSSKCSHTLCEPYT